jgi:hypothetical protein
MSKYKWNPKVKGSGIITAIPQTGICPNKCADCFFQSGRSYLEPLAKNLPHLPPAMYTLGRVVRINDGNDSNIEKQVVLERGEEFSDCFFNTAIPNLDFPAPVVLTINPGGKTDTDFYKVKPLPNLMFVRIRVNAWNLDTVVRPAVEYYTERGVPVVLTFMAYYTETVPFEHSAKYEWRKRTLNSYWVLTRDAQMEIERMFDYNPLVYTCGHKGEYACSRCGNCLREYYAAKERLREEAPCPTK